MMKTMPRVRLGRNLAGALRIAGVAMLLAGAAVYLCYRADCAVLRGIAERIVKDVETPAERVLAVNTWVHWHDGFVANPQSYVFSRLGATPLQVVDGGGDCADKSRLVVALLCEIGIPATPAMCFDPKTGEPVHTVVEASLPDGHIVVDPSFNLWFPKKTEPGQYYGLLGLRRDPGILQSRLHEVTSSRNYWMRVNGYRKDRSVYDRASTFNWGKNFATRGAHAMLAVVYGEDADRLRRPRAFEEPKLAVAWVATLLGGSMIACSSVLALRARRSEVAIAEGGQNVTRSAAETVLEESSFAQSVHQSNMAESA